MKCGTFSNKFLVLALTVLFGIFCIEGIKVDAAISIAPIQQATGFASSSVPTYTITLPSSPTNGNFLTFEQALNGTAFSLTGISQTGVTWNRAVVSTTTAQIDIWYGIVGPGAGTVATMTHSSSSTAIPAGSIQEWSGVKTSGTIVGPVAENSGMSTNPAPGTITPPAGKEMLLITGVRKSNTLSSYPTGFGGLTPPSPGGTTLTAAYAVATSTSGSYTPVWTFGLATAWAASLASFYGVVVDVTAPSVPGSLAATPISHTRADLSWASSTDNEWVSYYNIYRCTGVSCTPTVGLASTTVGTLSYSDTTLATSTTYGYAISATDEQGNQSSKSSTVYATTTGSDVTAPVISEIASSTPNATTATVSWTTDENSTSKVAYGTSSGNYTLSSTSASLVTSHLIGLTGLSTSTQYYYVVVSADAAGNISTSTEKTLLTRSSTIIVYDFSTDTVGQVPLNTTPTSGTYETANHGVLGKSLRSSTTTVGNLGALSLNNFTFTTDYSVIWKEAYDSTGGRNGFMLRAQSADSASLTGVKQGYYFNVNHAGANTAPNTARIYIYGVSSQAVLQSTALTSATPRWFKATVSGSTLSFFYSDDGITYTQIGTNVTDTTYASGVGVQYIVGNGTPVGNDYVDDITQINSVGDVTPPVISSIASTTSITTGTVTWTTDESATSKVAYGTSSGNYTFSSTSASLVTSHSIGLTGLSASTQYYYVVVSADVAGNISTSTEKTLLTNPSLPTTTIIYDFENEPLGQSPYNTTIPLGAFEVANQATLGHALHAVVSSSSEATVNLTGFASSSDYSVTWKEAYDTTGRRHGFILRAQAADGGGSNVVKQGYSFQVNHGGSSGSPNTVRISRVDSTFTTLQATSLTSISPRWFRAVVNGSSLALYYSDDGVNYTITAASSTDSTFASGGVQYTAGSGQILADDYIDDITQVVSNFSDTTGPIISSVASTTATATGTVSWTTDENSTSKVSYGTSSGSYTQSSTSLAYTTAHSIDLTSLTSGTLYYYVVVSRDFYGNYSTSTEKTLLTVSPGGGGIISITTPKAYQVIQRSGSTGNISITGTYTGTPTSIEASFNGGAYATITASPTGGTFSGTLSSQTQGQGTLTVRFTNSTTTATTTAYVGIGDIFVVAGQSNASARGVTNNVYSHATLKATMFGNNDVWADLTDPLDSNVGQIDSVSSDSFAQMGSPYPLVATSFMADQNVPIAFIPTAKGGTSLSDWARNLATTTLYGSMYRRIAAAGGSVKGILWFQGESEADHGVDHGSGLAATRANYLTDLTTLANDINSDFGAKLVVTQIAFSGVAPHVTYMDDVRLAQIDAWNAGGNILPGPAFPDVNLADETGITGGDNIHFKSDADQLVQANRLWAAMKTDYYSGTDGRGPRLVSSRWGTSRSQIVLTFTDETLPLLPASSIGGFSVTDSVGAKTISSATRTSSSVITLTLSSAAVGTTTVSLATMTSGIGVNMPTDSSTINLPAEIFRDEPIVDTTAPTAPTSLTGTVGSTQVVLTWASSTDNTAVTAYKVYRCTGAACSPTTFIATSTLLTYTDTTLSATTQYGFAVSAVDATFNESSKSSTFATTTLSSADVSPPVVSVTAPTNLATVSGSGVSVTANASDNIAVFGVQFKLDGNNLGSEDTTSTYGITWDTTSATNGSHTIIAVARDAAGNYSTSSPISVTVSNSDVTAPTAPTSLTGTVSPSQVALTWASSTDAVGVTAYKVYRCTGASCSPTTFVATTTVLNYTDTSLSQTTQYGFAVSAVDAAFNESTKSSTFATTTTASPDVTAPTTPTSLTGTVISPTQVNITWASSTDAVGVTAYRVYRCTGASCSPTTFIATSTILSYADSSLSQTTQYGFAVSAVDAAFNESTKSSTFATTTPSSADVTVPTVSVTAPTNLATVSGSSVSVTANASDNIGVFGVQFKLDGANLGSEDTTSTYGITWDSTTATNGSHTIVAVARDAAGNYATSTSISVTVSNAPADVTAPTTPTSLTGAIISPTQINLTWASSTDAVGVTAYRVYRCTGSSCSPTTFIATTTVLNYSDTSLTQTTQYGFAVSAVDAAFNESSKSSTFATSTPTATDSNPPVVTLTFPTNGSGLSGIINVVASASDDVSVAGVQFKLDGANLASEVSAPPYLVAWDTRSVTDGVHSVGVTARDSSGNYATSSSVNVTVTNAVTAGGGGGGGGSSAAPSQTRRASAPSVIQEQTVPSIGFSQGVVNLILQNRVLFTEAVSLGIYIDPSILQVLGIAPTVSVTTAPNVPVKITQVANGFYRELSPNMVGTDVRRLQEFLIEQDTGPAARALAAHASTAIFGVLTKAALMEFQISAGILPATGNFGPQSRVYFSAHGY